MTARRVCSFFVLVAACLALPAVASPATPGPNGRIVFASTPPGAMNTELFSVAPDGTGVTRLTWSWPTEQAASWSPDGSLIAYESLDVGLPSVHVMTAHGTNQRRVSPGDGSTGGDTDPTWSPDGSQIAFASTRVDSWRIWVMNADGTGLRRVSDDFGTSPAWSPDGTRIAYVAGGQAIATIRPDGTDRRQLTFPPTGYSDDSVSWSPDGRQLVFARNQTFANSPQLYVIDADGSNERQLTFGAGANRFPSWSPDGTQIVFTHDRQLYVIGADGSGMRPLLEGFGEVFSPDWGTSTIVPAPEVPGAPRITIFSPQARQYPPGEPIHAIYICESDTSFVVSCEGDLPFGAMLDPQQTGVRTFTVRAADAEGRTSTATVTFEVMDWVPPTIDVRAPADGAEYEVGQSVEVDYECSDGAGGSGIELCDGELKPGWPLDTSRTGTFTVHFWALDRSRNLTQKAVTYRVVQRDGTAPTITIASPAEGATFLLGESATVSFRCADEAGGSGLELCDGDRASGAALDTATVGARTFTVRARDRARNSRTLTRNYRVLYAFSGFFAPLVAFPELAPFRAGENVPVKFSLTGNHGLGVVASGSWRRIDCASDSPLGEPSAARQALSYQAQTDRYFLKVETDPSWKGTCRRLAVTLADGTTHLANVRFD